MKKANSRISLLGNREQYTPFLLHGKYCVIFTQTISIIYIENATTGYPEIEFVT